MIAKQALANFENDNGETVTATIESSKLGIFIGVDGYGEHTSTDDSGLPIVVEYYGGKLRVLVWSDINNEEPTHVIDMSGALLSNRKINKKSF